MLRTLVRLAFHDCASTRCDGCIDTTDTRNNPGLAPMIQALNPICTKYGLTKADCWAAAGSIAVEETSYNGADLALVPLFFGRTDATACTGFTQTNPEATFPAAASGTPTARPEPAQHSLPSTRHSTAAARTWHNCSLSPDLCIHPVAACRRCAHQAAQGTAAGSRAAACGPAPRPMPLQILLHTPDEAVSAGCVPAAVSSGTGSEVLHRLACMQAWRPRWSTSAKHSTSHSRRRWRSWECTASAWPGAPPQPPNLERPRSSVGPACCEAVPFAQHEHHAVHTLHATLCTLSAPCSCIIGLHACRPAVAAAIHSTARRCRVVLY